MQAACSEGGTSQLVNRGERAPIILALEPLDDAIQGRERLLHTAERLQNASAYELRIGELSLVAKAFEQLDRLVAGMKPRFRCSASLMENFGTKKHDPCEPIARRHERKVMLSDIELFEGLSRLVQVAQDPRSVE